MDLRLQVGFEPPIEGVPHVAHVPDLSPHLPPFRVLDVAIAGVHGHWTLQNLFCGGVEEHCHSLLR